MTGKRPGMCGLFIQLPAVFLNIYYLGIKKEKLKGGKMKERKEKDLEWFKKKSDKELIDAFNSQVGNPGWVGARADYLSAMHEEFDNRLYDYSIIKSDDGGIFLRHKVKLVDNYNFELLLSKEEERIWFAMESWSLGIRRNKARQQLE